MKILLKRHEMFMVPLKDLVVFPRMVVPLFVGRRRSLRSVEEATRLGRPLFLVSQKKTGVEEPDERDVHDVGTVARVLQMLKLPDGKIRLLVEGLERAAISKYSETRDSFRVIVRPLPETRDITPQMSALMRAALSQFTRFAEVSKKVPPEAVTAVESAELPDALVDLIAGNLPLKLPQKLELLSIENPETRLERCAAIVASEIEVLSLEQEITGQGQAEAGEDAERLLSQRATQGDPAGAGRGGGGPDRRQGAGREGESQGASRRSGGEMPEGAQAPGSHAAHVTGVCAPEDLPGMDRGPAMERGHRGQS